MNPVTDHVASPDRWLRTPEAARLLALSPSTLAKLRCTGGGPEYIKLGRAVAYAESALRAWLAGHPTRRNTSEAAA